MLSPLLPEGRGEQDAYSEPGINRALCECGHFFACSTKPKRTPGDDPGMCQGAFPATPSPTFAPYPPHSHHLSEHTCHIFQGSQSPKEKQSPWAAAGSNSSPTVPVMRILLQREFDKEKDKEKRGGYDNRKAEQTISSPDTGKLVLKVTCF